MGAAGKLSETGHQPPGQDGERQDFKDTNIILWHWWPQNNCYFIRSLLQYCVLDPHAPDSFLAASLSLSLSHPLE